MVQLAVTVGFIALFVYQPDVKMYSRQHPEMWLIAFAMTFVLLIVLACCNDFRRRHPLNIILLSLFTICEGFMLGAVSSLYQVSINCLPFLIFKINLLINFSIYLIFKSEDVLIAVGICTGVCLALTIFAMQTKWDFTGEVLL